VAQAGPSILSRSHELLNGERVQILAIDVGAGTQDILVYDSERTPENCFKLVLPSQTNVVAQRILRATANRRPVHLTGHLMGGGASTAAIANHLEAGLRVTAEPNPAQTVHNDLERVTAMGVEIVTDPPEGAEIIELGDIDLRAIHEVLGRFEIEPPALLAVAVQDHGFEPGRGNNDVRFEFLQSLISDGGELSNMIFTAAPQGMTRMEAVQRANPGAYLMDTGSAAVLGALGDPVVAEAAQTEGVILVNVGNMHTFATLVKGDRLYGLFEHHTGGITPEIIVDLVDRLRRGTIDADSFTRDFDGHGAALDSGYASDGGFSLVAVTGPNRGLARSLGYHEAAPHGDMMLTGSFGLVEGVLRSRLGVDSSP
jgi:uncharacterized protein (DUF1786 family)